MHSLRPGERSRRSGSRDSPAIKIAGLAFFALRERELDQIMQGHVYRSKLFDVYSKLNATSRCHQSEAQSRGSWPWDALWLAGWIVTVRKIIKRIHYPTAASPLQFEHNL